MTPFDPALLEFIATAHHPERVQVVTRLASGRRTAARHPKNILSGRAGSGRGAHDEAVTAPLEPGAAAQMARAARTSDSRRLRD
jgi:hypothetical protein